MEKIVFNVDIGTVIKEKDILKEIDNTVLDAIKKGKPVKAKIAINPETAIDDNGNPISDKEIKRFTSKCEKQLNSIIGQLSKTFGKNMVDTMTNQISSDIKTQTNELFNNLTASILNRISDMQNDISVALGKSITVDMDDIIKVNNNSKNDNASTYTDNLANDLKIAKDNLKKATSEFEKYKNEYDKTIQNLSSDSQSNIKIGRITYDDEYIDKLLVDNNKTKNKLKSLFDEYKKIDEIVDMSDDDVQVQNLEEKQKSIALVIQKIINQKSELNYELSTMFDSFSNNKNDDNIINDILEFDLDELNNMQRELKTKLDIAKREKESAENIYNDLLKKPEIDALGGEKKVLQSSKNKTRTNIHIDPKLNTDKFIKKVFVAIDEIEKNIKPVEVPIALDAESKGEFIADVMTSFEDYPVKIKIDNNDFTNQIKEATKGITLDLNGTVSNLSVNQINSNDTSFSKVESTPNIKDSYEDDEYIQYLESMGEVNTEIDNNFMNSLVQQMSQVNNESSNFTEELNEALKTSDNITNNINEIKKTTEELAKEIADELVGKVEVVTDNEIIDLQDKIKGYKVLKDLRLKNKISKKSEESNLYKRKNNLKKPNESDLKPLSKNEEQRLQQLEQERLLRQQIKNEWSDIVDIASNLNTVQGRIDFTNKELANVKELQSKKIITNKDKEKYNITNVKDKNSILKEEANKLNNQLELDKKLLQSENKRLDIAKATSSYFGNMSNSVLASLSNDVLNKKNTPDALIKKTLEKIETKKNQSVGSKEYEDNYNTSLNRIINTSGKHSDSIIEKENKRLKTQFELWNDIDNAIKTMGKERALDKYNSRIEEINKTINSLNEKQKVLNQRKKNSTISSTNYEDESNLIKSQIDEAYAQKSSTKDIVYNIKKYSAEEINTQRLYHKAEYKEFKSDIRTKEGLYKQANQLRYKDLNNFKKYQDEYNKQNDRRNKSKSYKSQIEINKTELIASGINTKEAETQAINMLEKDAKNDFYNNEKAIKKYNSEIQNLELDMNEVVKLMEEINSLNEKLATKGLSEEENDSLKSKISKKRTDLETIISRTGWDQNDILNYNSFKNYIDNKNSNNSTVVKKDVSLDNFNKNATSIKQIVDNIGTELNNAISTNDQLIDNVDSAEKQLEEYKKQITLAHQSDAEKTLSIIKGYNDKKTNLLAEIDNMSDGEDKSAKEENIKVINGIINKLNYKYKTESNPSKLQVAIDKEYNQKTKFIQDSITAKKNQIIVNNDYIKSLKQMMEEQEKVRRSEEPTKEELEANKKALISDKSKNTKKYNSDIKEVNVNIASIESKIKDAEGVAELSINNINDEINILNQSLKEAQDKLDELENRKSDKVTNQTNIDSKIYDEYKTKLQSYNNDYNKAKSVIDDLNNKNKNLLKQNEEIAKKYSQGNKPFNAEELINEIPKIQKAENIKDIVERIGRIDNYASLSNNPVAQKDKQKYIIELQKLLNNTDYSFAQINEEIDASGKKVKTLIIDIKKMNKQLSPAFNKGDSVSIQNEVLQFSENTSKINSNNDIIKKTSYPDPAIHKNISSEYAKQLYNAFILEQNELNKEISNSVEPIKYIEDLSEEAEEHLLNMQRYMNEYNKVSGKNSTKSIDVDTTTKNLMTQAWENNKDVVSNTSGSQNKINLQLYEQQKIVDKIKEQISLKEKSKKASNREVESLRVELKMQEQKKIQLEEEKNKSEELFSLEQKRIKKQIIGINNVKKVNEESNKLDLSYDDSNITVLEKEKEELNELENVNNSVSISQVDNQNKIQAEVIETTNNISKEISELENSKLELSKYIKSNKVKDIKENPSGFIEKYNNYMNLGGTSEEFSNISKSKSSLISFVQSLSDSETKARDKIIETNNKLHLQQDILNDNTTPTSSSNTIISTQQKAQEEIKETNIAIDNQIKHAVNAAQVSISEGSSVSINGSVKVDESQFGALTGDLTGVKEVAYELLEVVKSIYVTIASGTQQAITDINNVSSPIKTIGDQIEVVNKEIASTNIKVRDFADNIKIVGNADLNSKEFKEINEAVSLMNSAISKNPVFNKLVQVGDVTAKFVQSNKNGKNGDEEISQLVKLNTTFRDTSGQIIKASYLYDILNNNLIDVSNITSVVSNKFSQQEKSIKRTQKSIDFYASKLDKIRTKYESFNINDFGIDDDNNLFAKVGTNAEKVIDIISGDAKKAIKEVISQIDSVENKFLEIKSNSNGILSEDEFIKETTSLNHMIDKLDGAMNEVNRKVNTQLEHVSRNLLNSWQKELAKANSYMYDNNNDIVIDTRGLNKNGLNYIEEYKQELLELSKLYDKMQQKGKNFSKNDIFNWQNQISKLSRIKKMIYENSSKEYVNGKGYIQEGYSIGEEQFSKLSNSKNSEYAKQLLMGLAKSINKVDVEFIKLSKDQRKLEYSFADINGNIQTCQLSVEDFGNTVRNTILSSTPKVSLFTRIFGTLKDKLVQITRYLSAYEIFYKVINSLKSGINIIKELDSAMTEMKKVSHGNTEELERFAKTSHRIAQEIGSTASTIQNSAADWMRLGYSIEEASGLAKNTSILMNVSEFEDIDTATESMVAMIQAFKKEGSDVIDLSSTLIDKLNNIGNNYSISTSELAESLKRSSGTLIAANNSVDEAIALTTAGNAIIQDAETTGSALKVISMRIRGTTVEALEKEGEDTEGLIETTSKLEEKVKSLTAINGKLGVSLTNNNGDYRTTYEILQDISDIWDEIENTDKVDGKNRQAALLELLAGKTRAQSLASILQNGDMLRSVYEDVQNSEGSAKKENDVYMNSIESHLEVLTAKWQELWDDSLSKETINWVIDRLGDITKIVDDIGLIPFAAAIGSVLYNINNSLKGNNKSGGRAKEFALRDNISYKICLQCVA